MPYINENRRRDLEPLIEPLADECVTQSEYNYAITRLLFAYWRAYPRYERINDILGVLEGVKLEFYRRVAVPYENKKIEENGDVYL